MRSNKHGIKALALAMMAAALGLMAFAASGAQAQTLPGASTTGLFLINLTDALLATATGQQVGPGKLLVPGRQIEVGCDTAHISEGKIDSPTDALAKIVFLLCFTYTYNPTGLGELIKECVIKGGSYEDGGTIETKVLIKPILHGAQNFVLIEPQEGNFANVTYIANLGCVLPLNNPVSGSVVAQVHEEAVQLLVLFSETIQLLSGDVLKYGEFPAYVDAHARINLTGSHEGLKLGVH
jgi:hypothetical protein